jgi:hypothetical protein
MPRIAGQRLIQNSMTCPYWVRGPVFKMLTVIYGCGGYGEVAPNHPAAGTRISVDDEATICKRCHGTGLILFSKSA